MTSSPGQAPRGYWVEIEDQYDRDWYRLGPFPTIAAAIEYCDAHNAAQLKPPRAPLDDRFVPTDVGVWSLASCAGYEVSERLLRMSCDPSAIPRDDDAAIQRRHGARTEVEWRLDEVAAASVDRCWCAELRAGVEPAATADQLEGYVRRDARQERRLPVTQSSDGSLDLCRCAWCGGAVVHLMIEVDGPEPIVHHYYTPISEAELAAFDGATYETLAALRPGIYSVRTQARAYRRAEIGTARLEGWPPAGSVTRSQVAVQGWLFETELGDGRFFVPDDACLLVGRDPSCDVWVIDDDVAPIAMLVDGVNARVSVDKDKPTPLVVNGVRTTGTELQDGMRLRIAIAVEYKAAPFSGPRLRDRPPRADEVRRFARELGRQLARLHERGLVHGAITPEQVLVDAAGAPWLLVHRPVRAGSVAAGSDPEYLAPEVRAGGPLTTAADVYALGTLLVPALRDAASDLGLVTFVSHMMKDDPAGRPAAAEL